MLNEMSSVQIDAPEQTGLYRRALSGDMPDALTSIYEDACNMAIWRRALGDDVSLAAQQLVRKSPHFKLAMNVAPQDAEVELRAALGQDIDASLSADISQVVEMFCCLFELERAGLRIAALSKPMCPRFHVDHVPCRLVTTYTGVATEWLEHRSVNRAALGSRDSGLTDLDAGLYQSEQEIQQLGDGDLALLKGERWEGNEGAGLVHRSPAVPPGETRLVVTLDVAT